MLYGAPPRSWVRSYDASGLYYGVGAASTTAAGNPSDAIGWALAAGVKINFPMVGPGDYFAGQISYTQGALGYLDDGAVVASPTTPGAGGFYSSYNGGAGGTYGFGVVADGVYGAGTSV